MSSANIAALDRISKVVDRQELYAGTEAPPSHLVLDSAALAKCLSGKVPGIVSSLQVEKFKGGQSNPTYRLKTGIHNYVLRRRPPGELLASAHAIDREYRVLLALSAAGFPVPHPYFYCEDERVIGSTFYIVDFCDGRVFWNAELPGVTPADRTVIYDQMNALLAKLHNFDLEALGLEDFGKSENYTARNLARWTKIFEGSKLVDIPDMSWLIKTLQERLPESEPVTLVHGDFGLYNFVVHPSRPEIVAVLDWEMSTVGNPYVDLAHNVRAWWDTPDPEHGSSTSLRGRDLQTLGIPEMDDYIATYCGRMSIPNLPDRQFYLSYAQFRYAAMIQGILKRASTGTAANRVILHRQERVFEIAALARQTLEQMSV